MFARLCQHHGPGLKGAKGGLQSAMGGGGAVAGVGAGVGTLSTKRRDPPPRPPTPPPTPPAEFIPMATFILSSARAARVAAAAAAAVAAAGAAPPPPEGKRRHSWSTAAAPRAPAESPPPPPRAASADRRPAAPATAAAAGGRRWASDSESDAEAGDSGVEDSRAHSTWCLDTLDGDPPPPVPDLVGPCRDLHHARELSRSPSPAEDADEDTGRGEDMGQRPSALLARSRPKLSLTWVLRGQQASSSSQPVKTPPPQPPPPPPPPPSALPPTPAAASAAVAAALPPPPRVAGGNATVGPPPPPRVAAGSTTVAAQLPPRTLSEPSLAVGKETARGGGRPGRERHRHRRSRTPRHKDRVKKPARFGYEIQDVDAFLTKASIEKPANIPVVLASPCVLYQTRTGGYQDEVALPLGMVVNAVFKNQAWLYVQTPHGEEGYVNYGACLPLGILPPPQRSHSNAKPPPCWETHTDIFPQPLGNRTDNEKLRDGTRSECGGARSFSSARRGRYGLDRDAVSACGERSVDRLYLRAAANAKSKGTTRHTLLVIRSDYNSKGRNTLSVSKGDVVALVSGHMKDWFWVRSRDGNEGFIPSVVAGHGFL